VQDHTYNKIYTHNPSLFVPILSNSVVISLDLVSVDKEQLWAWEYQTDGDKHDLYMDVGEELR